MHYFLSDDCGCLVASESKFTVVLFIGKNPYAMSVLSRVEMKLDGRDIADNR